MTDFTVEDDRVAALFDRELRALSRLRREIAEFVFDLRRTWILFPHVCAQIEVPKPEPVLFALLHYATVFHQRPEVLVD
ncbi:hypothetical protein C462_00492 [Halorubrum distributum JCM 13916]|uniref:Uncharacterized protein n=1 Tax=Halorubrum distributum JCM 13916 TaxID=1230455 RepID=M0PV38_9EURY|nr:hypothetical protein C462_00492 [Halorubrum arcis JCM 13916]